MTNVREIVEALLMNQLGVDKEQIVDTATLGDDLGADSLDAVEMVIAVEEEFEIEVEDEAAEKITTVGELISAISARVRIEAAND